MCECETEPPLKRRRISDDFEVISIDILPAELVQIIIEQLECDLKIIMRLSRTSKKWRASIWSYLSHLDVTNGQIETEQKPAQYHIQPLLERISCVKLKTLAFTYIAPITLWFMKDKSNLTPDRSWFMEYMTKMTKLESMTVSNHLPVQFLGAFTNFSKLTSLTIDCSYKSFQADKFLENVSSLTALKSISITGAITSTQHFENLPNLISLQVPVLPASRWHNTGDIARLTQLQSLSVNNMTEESSYVIASMTNLRTFIAPGRSVNGELKDMPNLEYLKVKSYNGAHLPHNLTYLSAQWSVFLVPLLGQLHAYEGDLFDKHQLHHFNKHTNITHLSLSVSQFTYPMLTVLTNIKSLIITDPDIAEYPTELFLKTFQTMTSLRRIEFLVANGETSFDIAAKFPLKHVVLSTRNKPSQPVPATTGYGVLGYY